MFTYCNCVAIELFYCTSIRMNVDKSGLDRRMDSQMECNA